MTKKIKYTMTAPVSHIGETASTGSYFNMITTSEGKIPVITGNSIRGQLRDCLAAHLLSTLNVRVDKEIFQVLFSGGNISGSMKDDVERSRLIREHFPFISLLGGGLGTMIMSGKLLSGFAYPICDETCQITNYNLTGHSWHEYMDAIEFSRMDDSKNDIKSIYINEENEDKKSKASTQMRYEVEYMAAGTEFIQTFTFLDGLTDLELGAFYTALKEWFKHPRLGGMSGKGFGFFDAEIENEIKVNNNIISMSDDVSRLIANYENYVQTDGSEWLCILKEGKQDGKKANKAVEDNSTLN